MLNLAGNGCIILRCNCVDCGGWLGKRIRLPVRLFFIGGQPKGEPEPFSVNTHSGRILRRIVAELKEFYDFDVQYFDLWKTEKEETVGRISALRRRVLTEKMRAGWHIVPLGHYVHERLQRAKWAFDYYPHPARNGKQLKEKLEADIAFWTCSTGSIGLQHPKVNTP